MTPPAWPTSRRSPTSRERRPLGSWPGLSRVNQVDGWFSEQGITCRRIPSDNGPAYRSGDWRKACRTFDLKPIRTKPYTPQTNRKAERFIKTLLAEWA